MKSKAGKNNPNWRGGGIKKKCLVCNAKIIATISEHKRGHKRFCSGKCYGKWRAKNIKKERCYQWNGGTVEIKCAYCKKIFKIRKYLAGRKSTRTCSRKCMGLWQSQTKRGNKSYNWKGGITPAYKQIRASDKYLNWRQQVFIRDNFTCQKCRDNTGGNLHSHHIKPFTTLLDEVKINLPLLPLYEAAMLYAPLWNINNGITYCNKCHRKNHKKKKVQ